MFLLDWRLALFSPRAAAVLRAARAPRRRPAAQDHDGQAGRDGRHVLARAGVAVGVSGILLGKTMGRGAELADRFEGESANLADLEVRSRMAGRWMMAAIQTSFAVMPALVYLFAGLAPGAASIGTIVAFTTLQTRLFFPVQSLLSVGVDIQTSTALFDRVFEYLDLEVDIEPGTRSLTRRPRRGPLRRRLVPLRRRVDAARHRRRPSRRARAPRWSARPARARPRSATSRRGSTTPSRAPCASTASTCAS